MSLIIQLVSQFWDWTEISENQANRSLSSFNFDPLAFPKFHEMQACCTALINTQLTPEELDAFLTCMALDEEDEEILDGCKALGNDPFISSLVACGVHHRMREARWQIAELLRKNIPGQQDYLELLLHDEDQYVQKRARNVMADILGKQI